MRAGGAFVGLGRNPGGLAILLAVLAFVLVAAVLTIPAGPVLGSPAVAGESSPTLVLFHGEGCPHCAAERAWLQELAIEYPDLRIEQYEVWNDEANREVLRQYAAALGFQPSGVPVTIVADQVWIGFSDTVAAEIESAVAAASAGSGAPSQIEPPPAGTIDVPLLGTVTLAGSSLVLSTALIGFADGINPCSLWVLAVLLAIVLHSGSRGRVLLVGSTFLLVTAAMYGLFIAGMYSALDYVSGLPGSGLRWRWWRWPWVRSSSRTGLRPESDPRCRYRHHGDRGCTGRCVAYRGPTGGCSRPWLARRRWPWACHCSRPRAQRGCP